MFAINFEQIWTNIILFLPKVGAALLILLIFWVIARINRGVVQRFAQRKQLSPDIINLMGQITEVILLVFGVITAFGTLGIDVGAMIASLGLVGFALGYALRDLLSNFLSGLMILMYNPFVRGDIIQVVGNQGSVIEINLRYTVLQDDHKRILIPNATLFSNPVIVERKAPNRMPGGDSGL